MYIGLPTHVQVIAASGVGLIICDTHADHEQSRSGIWTVNLEPVTQVTTPHLPHCSIRHLVQYTMNLTQYPSMRAHLESGIWRVNLEAAVSLEAGTCVPGLEPATSLAEPGTAGL